MRDAMQPGSDAGLRLPFRGLFPQPDESLLRHILGEADITQDPQGQPICAVQIEIDNDATGRGASSGDSLHKLSILFDLAQIMHHYPMVPWKSNPPRAISDIIRAGREIPSQKSERARKDVESATLCGFLGVARGGLVFGFVFFDLVQQVALLAGDFLERPADFSARLNLDFAVADIAADATALAHDKTLARQHGAVKLAGNIGRINI